MPKELKIPDELDLNAFISKEAHDLKSPFNRALGFLKLVLKGMDGPISDQAREDLTIVSLNIQYSLTMIEALVNMARLGRGERSLTATPLPVDYILPQTVSEWKRKYHKENPVEITYTSSEIQVNVDEIMIRQGLQQWISYVNEFTQENAAIEIRVEDQPEGAVFTVESRGTKRQPPPECDLTMYGFVGQKIVELHGGQLLIVAETEQGAQVQFRLPKAE